jgi:hypothetical protein
LNRWILTSGLAGVLALPLLVAPASASASCTDRKVAGTVVGGVGGALIGNSIARGGAGAVLGGLGGAVVGHEVARSTCTHEHRQAEYHRADRPYQSGYGPHPSEMRPGDAQAGEVQPPRTAYYDSRGNLIDPGAAVPSAYAAAPDTATPYASAAGGPVPACRPEPQPYYNDRGELVQEQVQTCVR